MTTYIWGGIGAAFAALLAVIGVYHFATVPHLQAEIAQAQAREKTAEAQSIAAQSDRDALRSQLDDANARLESFAGQCRQVDTSARLAAQQAADKPIARPAVQTATDINAWLRALLSSP